jgi:SAM-dependent methyltransferase
MDEQTYYQVRQALIEAHVAQRPEFNERYLEWKILNEDTPFTDFDAHYIYFVAWAIRKLAEARPALHVDFSSSLNFVTAAAAICPTRFYDLRPAQLFIEGLECLKADLMGLEIESESLDSVSCMHVVEHVGLGRYGDTPDALGDLKAISELKRIVRPGGRLYMVAPSGMPAVVFNAHRIYPVEAFVGYFADQFDLEELYFIQGEPKNVPPLLNPPFAETLPFNMGCGCYMFRKR